MGFWDELWQGITGRSAKPAREASAPRPFGAATGQGGWKCPHCGRAAVARPARKDLQLVAAVAAEVVAYEAEDPTAQEWGVSEAIAQAHGLTIGDIADEAARMKARRIGNGMSGRKAPPPASRSRIKTIQQDDMRLLDLRHLESTPLNLRGIAHYVSERGRALYGDSALVLKREPTNPHDSFAIAVSGKGRMLGHISAARAAQLTPMLDRLGYDGYIVQGIVEQVPGRMTQLHAMLPRVPVLRAWVKEQGA